MKHNALTDIRYIYLTNIVKCQQVDGGYGVEKIPHRSSLNRNYANRKHGKATNLVRNTIFPQYILSLSESLPVSKLSYFGKYIIQLYDYMYYDINVTVQRQNGLEG